MAMIVFVAIAVVGQALNVGLCLMLDRIFSPTVGAMAFVLLYMLVFAGAWMLTLRLVEGEGQQRLIAAR